MKTADVRVRFAPSPTGGLHLGGVRTVLYNYLFAKKHGGKFILRIEDTDQTRFVPGAEEYIFKTLEWCGLQPDESTQHGGNYGPYRQSERKPIYLQYALQLIEKGMAYYAFDTAEDLDMHRKQIPNFLYNHTTRNGLKNSLVLGEEKTAELLAAGTPYVIRIKMPENEPIEFNDLIRGHVQFNSGLSDDKVLLKADGMPTYHLAVVVDDYLMKITHAFRGEEWLPSAPVHVLVWKHLFGIENMPQWAHLPLILKPDGNGKLSKRDGERLGFPVFAMDWFDPRTQEATTGFKERGFLPQAFVNMLAMLGWNDGTEKELYALPELIEAFSLDRVHKGGAKFDYEKAKWFNNEWIKQLPAEAYVNEVATILHNTGIEVNNLQQLTLVINAVKERCTFLTDFVQQAGYFFQATVNIDFSAIKPKWNAEKTAFFQLVIQNWESFTNWDSPTLENSFKELAVQQQIKPGDVMLPLRLMLVGGKFGPHVFDIAQLLGKNQTIERIKHGLTELQN